MPKAKYPVKSLVKAMQLLDTLAELDSGTNLTSLSKQLKTGKSTVHRLLATLRDFDLVWYDTSSATYALGAKVLRWGDLVSCQNLLIRRGLPRLRDLVQATGETANLAVLEGASVIYMAQFESLQTLRLTEAVGSRGYAHCTALGKALLAASSEEVFQSIYGNGEALAPMTPNSIRDPLHLREHLEKVRQEGVAFDFEENVVGVVCMGTVVRDHTGQAMAAMSISVPTQRLQGEKLLMLKRQLLDAASGLSLDLGYTATAAAQALAPQSNRPTERPGPPTSRLRSARACGLSSLESLVR
jgi:IclR family transcriptional regulator, acetate operon repressor